MLFWPKYPFIRILFFYIVGIILAYCVNIFISSQIIYFLVILATCWIITLFYKAWKFKYRMVPGILLGAILSLLGILITIQHRFEGKNIFIPLSKQDYLIQIIEEPGQSAKSIKTICKILLIHDSGQTKIMSTKAMIYFSKDSLAQNLQYGDLVKANISLSPVAPPANPHEFNYKQYLENHQIYFQAFIPSGKWMVVGHSHLNYLKFLALKIRQYFLEKLGKSNLSEKEFSVAAAILLGQDDILDVETRQDYAGAGAMHVLCVSGLHVGIIYLAFGFLLSLIKKRGTWLHLKTLLLLLIIWAYALITGFSPSVLRASVMLSFIIFGNAINKKGNIYNSIAASAFFLLLFNPLMIREVGFQLSYAAVIGIVSIYPLIKKHLYHHNKIIDNLLAVLIVSFAAQLGTFPLAVFYFHQFPVYFLFTNLVVIFLATLIIYLGFTFLLFSSVPVLSSGIQFVFKLLIGIMNNYVAFIESIPGSTLNALVLSCAEVFLFYLFITSITQAIFQKSKSWFMGCLVSFMMILAGFGIRNFSHWHQKKLIIYKVAGCSVIEIQNGRKNQVFMDTALITDQQKINYHLCSNWWYSGIKNPEIMSTSQKPEPNHDIYKYKDFYFLDELTFLRINKNNLMAAKKLQAMIDYLIISDSPPVEISTLYNQFKPKLIILDSSNTRNYEEKIKAEADKNGIPVYLVNKSGAYIKNFS